MLSALLAALIAAAPAQAAKPAGPQPQPRILGGGPADPATFPFAAAVLFQNRFACSGSVLDPRHIITAGHCAQAKLGEISVVTGRSDLRNLSTGQATPITAKYVHPDYPRKARHDLAVFTLANPTPAPAVTLAQSAEGDLAALPGTQLTVAGWGATTPFQDKPPGFLKTTLVNALNTTRCSKIYGRGFFGPSMVCAAGNKTNPRNKRSLRTSPCAGDSGGPLLGTNADGAVRLLGVVSYGPRLCGLPFAPVAYAKTFDAGALEFISAAIAAS